MPPVKSIPRLKPRKTIEQTQITSTHAEARCTRSGGARRCRTRRCRCRAGEQTPRRLRRFAAPSQTPFDRAGGRRPACVPRRSARPSRGPSSAGLPNTRELDASATSGWVTRNTTTQVEHGGQAEGEREALHLADREDVEHGRGEEAHGVGGQDRAPGPDPAARHGRPERAALPHLVLEPFEEDHERVRRDADRHDEPGDAGEVEREPDPAAEQHQHGEDDHARTAPATGSSARRARGSRTGSRRTPAASPTPPAMSPACSEASPRVAETVCASDASNDSGSEP